MKTRQDKTRQDKTRQDKTRQDKTRLVFFIKYISPALHFFIANQGFFHCNLI
ncbi:hypothetical protein [Brachyspira pilosicoli]|uniref:hypothetical protein n=1 Tax=Brachyspira pilosicoli TaxID=52584 RepID=UPI0030046019